MSVANRTPVLIRVALYAQAVERDPTLHLVDYIERHLLPRAELGRYLRVMIDDGACLIILDGLDEVTNTSLRLQITERIRAAVATFGANHFLITSRIVGYDQSPLTREFTHATLRALTIDDQVRFIRLWYTAISDAIGDQALVDGADDLISALTNKPQIARVAANPLLLTIIVLMHWRGVKLPGRRVHVYQNATDTLIEYWTLQRGVTMDAEEIKAILGPVAHFILSRSVGGVISQHELLPRLSSGIVEQRGCDASESRRLSRELLRALNEQSGLFLERGQDDNHQPVYGFLHQTFGEYLAALHLANQVFSGAFVLADYIHRAVWREPLLLLAGHLSVYGPPLANQLIRSILDFPAPYEEILQRNMLLAGECLADDVHVQPDLRQEILDALARLIHHSAPQVRDAALAQHQRLAQTRHREAAVQSLKRVYVYDDTSGQPEFREWVGLNVAIALLHLRERELAWLALRPLLDNDHVDVEVRNTARRLRFEYWPEEAASYLHQLITRARSSVVAAGSDLAQSTLGPIDAGLAQRVLTPHGFRHFLEYLLPSLERDFDQAIVRWIAVLGVDSEAETSATVSSASALCVDLMTSSTPPYIRCMAATRLLRSEQRAAAIAVLQELIDWDYGQAVPAARVLVEAGEGSERAWQVLRDTAWMAQHYAAPQAIAALLQARDTSWALPAAFHLLATCQPGGREQRDQRLLTVASDLLKHGYTAVGVAAARWLALRPGYRYRIDACELLLEYGDVEQVIPLLQYLAYECHDESSQRACQRLLALKEADRVVPLLGHMTHASSPGLRYQAALALALASISEAAREQQPLRRTDLKLSILEARQRAYAQALNDFVDQGMQVLDTLSPSVEQVHPLIDLGKTSLRWLQAASGYADAPPTPVLTKDAPPALHVNAALFALRRGAVVPARQRLTALLKNSTPLSTPVHVFALIVFGEAATADDVSLFIDALAHPTGTVRWAAAHALSGRDVTVAREPLLRALEDESSSVRYAAARALGEISDREVVDVLIGALGDTDEGVRSVAAEALWQQGGVAVQPLIAMAQDATSPLRNVAAGILARLHDCVPVSFFVTALRDSDNVVRRHAAWALGFLSDPVATDALLTALGDNDPEVRWKATEALGRQGVTAALPDIHALLVSTDDQAARTIVARLEEFGATAIPVLLDILDRASPALQSVAAGVLGKLQATAAVPTLIARLTSDDHAMRMAAARALGQIRDRRAVQPLLAVLRDPYSLVVEAAAAALGSLGDTAAQDALIDVLATPGHFGRAAAATSLGALGAPVVIPELVGRLSDEDAAVRRAAAQALAKYADVETETARALIACLADDDAEIRSDVAAAFGQLRYPGSVGALLIALGDEASNVRHHAATALGKLGDRRAAAPLLAGFLDPDDHPRAAIAEALGQLHVREAGDLLTTSMLPDDLFSVDAVMARAVALIHLHPEGALDLLARHSRHFRLFDWLRSLLVGHALRRLGRHGEAAQHFQESLEEHRSASVLLAAGQCYLEMNDLEAAAASIREAVECEPEDAEGLLSQAVVLWLQGKRENAVHGLRHARSLDANIADPSMLRDNRLWGERALTAAAEMVASALDH